MVAMVAMVAMVRLIGVRWHWNHLERPVARPNRSCRLRCHPPTRVGCVGSHHYHLPSSSSDFLFVRFPLWEMSSFYCFSEPPNMSSWSNLGAEHVLTDQITVSPALLSFRSPVTQTQFHSNDGWHLSLSLINLFVFTSISRTPLVVLAFLSITICLKVVGSVEKKKVSTKTSVWISRWLRTRTARRASYTGYGRRCFWHLFVLFMLFFQYITTESFHLIHLWPTDW